MNIRELLKWTWRLVRFPFVLVIWVVICVYLGLVASSDWLYNPDKWNGLKRKDFEK